MSQTRAAKRPDRIFVLLCGVIWPAVAIGFEYPGAPFGYMFYEVVRPLPLALLALIVPFANVVYLWGAHRRFVGQRSPEHLRYVRQGYLAAVAMLLLSSGPDADRGA